jgi:FMN-dependent NADH-azoreductase
MSKFAQAVGVGAATVTAEAARQFVDLAEEAEVSRDLTDSELVELAVPELEAALQEKQQQQQGPAAADEDDPPKESHKQLSPRSGQ